MDAYAKKKLYTETHVQNKMYTQANVQTKMYMTFPGLLFLEHFALNAQVAQARAPTALSETNPNTHVIH